MNRDMIDDIEVVFETSTEEPKVGLPDPFLVEYYRKMSDRVIEINEEIDDTLTYIAFAIQRFNQKDRGLPPEERKPIKLFINSDGGCVDVALHIADAICCSATPVFTVGMGRVYSAGSLILLAGHKRFAFENTSCLIHDGSFGVSGSTGKMMDNLEFVRKLEDRVRDYILSSTAILPEVYDANYRRDWFMFSDEMLQYGIIDQIISDWDELDEQAQ